MKTAIVEGVYFEGSLEKSFEAIVRFETRKDQVTYIWSAKDESGTVLAMKGNGVPLRIIPNGEDIYNYCLNHAIIDIKKCRINRKRCFKVNLSKWDEERDQEP